MLWWPALKMRFNWHWKELNLLLHLEDQRFPWGPGCVGSLWAPQKEDASLFDLLWFGTSTPNHTSEEGRQSNVWIIQRGSEKRSGRPISGSSLAAVTLPSLIHGRCLGCRLELAAEWLRMTCLPGNSETNSLESRWRMCLVTLLDVR